MRTATSSLSGRTSAIITSSTSTPAYNAAGVPQGSQFLVFAGPKYDDPAASVAMDASGDFVVAWESDYGNVDSSELSVFCAAIHLQRREPCHALRDFVPGQYGHDRL